MKKNVAAAWFGELTQAEIDRVRESTAELEAMAERFQHRENTNTAKEDR